MDVVADTSHHGNLDGPHVTMAGWKQQDLLRTSGGQPHIKLFQYEICPFSCKVKAALDFLDLPYATVRASAEPRQLGLDVLFRFCSANDQCWLLSISVQVEVTPGRHKELKFSRDYRRVPIMMVRCALQLCSAAVQHHSHRHTSQTPRSDGRYASERLDPNLARVNGV